MNPWEMLEIEPTSDKKKIKSAYAKKLRKTHPDDNPEEFQHLNEAYQWALANHQTADESDLLVEGFEAIDSKAIDSSGSALEIVDSTPQKESSDKSAQTDPYLDLTEDNNNDKSTEDAIFSSELVESKTSFMPAVKFVEKFEALFKSGKSDAHSWSLFLQSPELSDFEYKQSINFQLFAKLIELNQVGPYINANREECQELALLFLWHDQELELCKYFPTEDVGQILTLLKPPESRSKINKKFVPTSTQNLDSEKPTAEPGIEIDSQTFIYLGVVAVFFVGLIVIFL